MKKTFTGNTRLFLCISGAIIVIALIMQIAGAGLNLGIDFTGGSILNYSVGEDYDVSDVETLLNASGYTDNQITKAAPSAASVALQAELAAELEKAATEVAEAAAEDPEVAAAVDEAVEEAVDEAVVEEAVAEAVTPTLGLLNPDKSGIVHDGLTDLQIRLKLADATEGMEDVIKGAVVSVVPGASETSYRNATNQEISTLGYALSYAGSNIVEFDMFGAYDKGAVEEAVKKALEDGGYSVNDILFVQYDAEAEAARIAEEQAAAEQAQAEAEAAEEAGEETAETEAPAEEAAEAEATEAPAEESTEAEATEAPAEESTEAEATEAPAEGEAEAAADAEAVAEPTESAGFQLRILIDMDDVTSQVRAQLEREMVAKYPNFRFVSIDHVSAIAGRDLLSNAIKALLIAFVCMLIYIAIRFSPLSGAAALFALLHDILIMCAFMVFFRKLFQVNSPFIAAILTIVGYSINNTIIIFDRIRETRAKPGYTQVDLMDVVEVSVSSTLSRTINTTLTTLFTLVCLYIFGVSSIKEFAFPLLVGMLAGTYSSVLLSGQVWAMWDKKLNANKAKKA
ncbi:MAG: protein translocase subunit SecF [Clostridia bacterium]|nr:protein translocase subunit SecF [Clostridia bacterium]